MAKIPFRPRPESVPNISYNRVLEDVAPTHEKAAIVADFQRSLARMGENSRPPNLPFKHSTSCNTLDLDTPPSVRPGLTVENQPTARSGKESLIDRNRHSIDAQPDHQPDTSNWKLLPSSAPKATNLQPSTGTTASADSQPSAEPSDAARNKNSEDAFVQRSERLKRSKDTDRDGELPAENILLLNSIHPTCTLGVGSVSAHEGQVMDLGVYETVESMLRQLNLLDNRDQTSTWKFSLQDGRGSPIELQVCADASGFWSVTIKAAHVPRFSDSMDELRDTLQRQNPNIGTVTVETGERE